MLLLVDEWDGSMLVQLDMSLVAQMVVMRVVTKAERMVEWLGRYEVESWVGDLACWSVDQKDVQ